MTSTNTKKLKYFLSESVKNGYSPVCVDTPTSKKVFGLGALTGSGLNIEETKWVPESNTQADKFLIKPGDFLVSRSNVLDKVGRAGLYEGGLENCSYPDLMMKFRVDEEKIYPRFLELILRSYPARKHFMRCASGTSGSMVKITKSAIESLAVPVVDIDTQKEIVEIIYTWKTAIEKTEQLISAKEKQFAALVQSLVNVHCSDDGWYHLKTRELFKSISSKKHPNEPLLSVTQDRGVIPRDMLEGRVMSPAGSVEGYKLVEPGNFVISLRSFQGGIEYSAYRGIVSPAYTVLTNKKPIHADFYKHFFKTHIFIGKYLRAAIIGIRDGKQVSFPDLESVKIPYPPIDEQERIANILNTAREEINLLKQQAELYRQQKRGLMQKLLTGEWRVKVDEEAA